MQELATELMEFAVPTAALQELATDFFEFAVRPTAVQMVAFVEGASSTLLSCLDGLCVFAPWREELGGVVVRRLYLSRCCVLCLRQFAEGDVVASLTCGHACLCNMTGEDGVTCVGQYLEQGNVGERRDTSCPLCSQQNVEACQDIAM